MCAFENIALYRSKSRVSLVLGSSLQVRFVIHPLLHIILPGRYRDIFDFNVTFQSSMLNMTEIGNI